MRAWRRKPNIDYFEPKTGVMPCRGADDLRGIVLTIIQHYDDVQRPLRCGQPSFARQGRKQVGKALFFISRRYCDDGPEQESLSNACVKRTLPDGVENTF